ncbi:hypothetical protein MSAN_00634900 [Mycena sanguinolenta]|uniref:Uncharacterized protein n=1 Tax=Mycena sanguinolenta TaxID=230812 RepID=A0A8H6Z315_9AGAR|nr:hypothetical protein MSAN_00634900 [Mycena sanguinolenta]
MLCRYLSNSTASRAYRKLSAMGSAFTIPKLASPVLSRRRRYSEPRPRSFTVSRTQPCFSSSLPFICCPRVTAHLRMPSWTFEPPPTLATISTAAERYSASCGGCLATIFACTWVSVHPNVPPPGQSCLQLYWRRLKMMLIAIIAPEIMVGFAARQFFASRRLSKEFEFSTMHGFFFCMGGFISSAGYPVATKKQLEDPALGSEFRAAIRNINEEDIMDKSKGDALSKSVALLQGMWFILQCVARVHQRIPVTQLEVATLAFAVVNLFIWLLWWNKPLDVQRPIVVGPPTLPHRQALAGSELSPSDWFLAAIFGFSANRYQPLASTSVPSFWYTPLDDGIEARVLFVLTLVGIVFGAIHCAAWTVVFPTSTEMWMWRTCSPVIAAIPGLASLQLLPLIATRRSLRERLRESCLLPMTFGSIIWVGTPLYIAARLILIVLAFMGLRSPPPSAFVDVNWSMYIPHI